MLISEKDFEDWVCENIEQVAGEGAVLVGRQVPNPTGGVMDVVAYHPGSRSLRIVELKREKIDSPAVVQLLEYLGGMRPLLAEIIPPKAARVRLEGILAAPRMTNSAALTIRAVWGTLRFVQLHVRIGAEPWGGVMVESVDDRTEDLFNEWQARIREALDQVRGPRTGKTRAHLREEYIATLERSVPDLYASADRRQAWQHQKVGKRYLSDWEPDDFELALFLIERKHTDVLPQPDVIWGAEKPEPRTEA